MPNHWLIQLYKECVILNLLDFLKDKPPICACCHFGQAHKRLWKTKGKHTNPIRYKDDVNPGNCVSIDNFFSVQPVLVPQISGYLTSDQIRGITLFVNHATDYTYGHLMRSLDLDETLGTKKAFERLVGRLDNTVKRYHADNEGYDNNGFMVSLNTNNQTITFYGVGAHHHNGIFERRIWNVTEIARTIFFACSMLLT